MADHHEVEHYSNPIIPGFSPDPSILQVDGVFYCCNSSFHLFPGLPIYASRDLKSWTHIGNALNRHSQMSLRGARTNHMHVANAGYDMVASMGIVASSIHHHNGVFYIATSKMELLDGKFGWTSFIISTTDIWSDQWSDPVIFDWNGIDVSLFFEDDRTYVQGSWSFGMDKQPSCSIYQVEIDLATGKWLGEGAREIWPGWTKHDTEGPHMYKVGGYYYLIAAEGGTFENHLLSVARSTDIWGPFTSWDQNPIATARGTDEYIQNVGHGALVQDIAGRWWAAVLAVRKLENGMLGLGRETFLSPVDWPEDGWPMVRQPKMRFTRDKVQTGPDLPANDTTAFDVPAHVEDLYIRDHDSTCYRYDGANGDGDDSIITLRPNRHTLSDPVETCTFLGRRQRALCSTAVATLDLAPADTLVGKKVTAGVALYKDPMRYATVAHDVDANTTIFNVCNVATSVSGSVSRKWPGPLVRLDLRVVARPLRCAFEARAVLADPNPSGQKVIDWLEVGSLDSMTLNARDYTGPLFGVFASTETDEGMDGEISFRGFRVVVDEAEEEAEKERALGRD